MDVHRLDMALLAHAPEHCSLGCLQSKGSSKACRACHGLIREISRTTGNHRILKGMAASRPAYTNKSEQQALAGSLGQAAGAPQATWRLALRSLCSSPSRTTGGSWWKSPAGPGGSGG